MKPRDYQAEAVYSVFRYFESGKTGNPLIALPTGTGKSIVIAYFLQLVYQWFPGQRIIMLTHVKELIEQNHDKLIRLWPTAPAGIYSAGLGKREYNNMITFGGIASVAKNPDLFGTQDLMIVDECHLISPAQTTMYAKFIAHMKKKNPNFKVIGLTATPYRLGFGSIVGPAEEGCLFTDICCDMTTVNAFNWFIQEGYLLPVVPKRTKMLLDINGVTLRGGEYVAGELQNAVNKEHITEKALREAMEYAEDRQSFLIFCAGVEHCIDTANLLTSMGIPCEAVHSKLKDSERNRILREYKEGKIRAVTNNNVLTTGFDHPGLDLIIMLRPTSSAVLWVQMLGRGTRPCPVEGFDMSTREGRLQAINASHKQNCLVLDFSGNTRRLGPINDPLTPKRKGEKGGVAPVKECEKCGMYNHASARHCGGAPFPYQMSGFCGNEFTFTTKLKAEASTQALVKSDLPIMSEMKVDHITYSLHTKQDKPSSLKVTYYCGNKHYMEFVCIEHDGFVRRKAVTWWTQRSKYPIPNTVVEALTVASQLKVPTHIRVHINKKYPEIMAFCYDGTCFNKEDAAIGQIQVEVINPDRSRDVNGVSINLAALGLGGPQVADPDADDLTPAEIIAHAARQAQPQMDWDDDVPF